METEKFEIQKELSVHQRGVILRGICYGAALQDKQPQISENNTVITCQFPLSIWDICSISCDAEAFGLKAKFGYDGTTRITFIPPSPQTYHCDKCGSTDVTPAAWCNYCGTHTTLTGHSEKTELREKTTKSLSDWMKPISTRRMTARNLSMPAMLSGMPKATKRK